MASNNGGGNASTANSSDAAAGGANNFIGALISLISKSDIRYQGFLASIDSVQATIALEKGEDQEQFAVLHQEFILN